MTVCLRALRGGGIHRFGPGVHIAGRSPGCQLILPDPRASRQHAQLAVAEGGLWVQDLGSRAGTFVDGRRINSQTQLAPNCVVAFGPLQFRCEVDTGQQSGAQSGRFRPVHLVLAASFVVAALFIVLVGNTGNASQASAQLSPTVAATPVPATLGAAQPAGTATPTPQQAVTLAPRPTAAATATSASISTVTNLDDAAQAVIRVVPVGSIRDPDSNEDWVNAGWHGSGFFIDSNGTAVTNNHVVTGAGLINVFVPGEAEPRNARVLGVSECNDLALIDVDGEGFPFLQWSEREPSRNLEVHSLGYPLDAVRVVHTVGEIVALETSVDTFWAYVKQAISHSAEIHPGNSGGPLVDEGGRVVGINYAGDEESRSYSAIAGTTMRLLVSELAAGNDRHSIGVNAQAVSRGSWAPVFVSSVATGSAAQQAGILPGDLIVSLEKILFQHESRYPTLRLYCDVLRSHDTTRDKLAVSVYRGDTDASLSGQINGEPLRLDN